MLAQAKYFVAGQSLRMTAAAPMAALTEALEYLITNTFNKMGYLRKVHDTPERALQEMQAVLRSNDIGQQTLAMQMEESNPQAIEDLRDVCRSLHQEQSPDGPARDDRETLCGASLRLADGRSPPGSSPGCWSLGDISLMMDGALLPLDKAYAELTTPSKRRRIVVLQRKTADPRALQHARSLGKEVFSTMGPDGEDALVAFLRTRLDGWSSQLSRYKTLADTGQYPGQADINDGLTLIKALLACEESYTFIERFNERKDDLLDFSDSYHDLEHFYEHQKPTWDRLRTAYTTYTLNRAQLEQDAAGGSSTQTYAGHSRGPRVRTA